MKVSSAFLITAGTWFSRGNVAFPEEREILAQVTRCHKDGPSLHGQATMLHILHGMFHLP